MRKLLLVLCALALTACATRMAQVSDPASPASYAPIDTQRLSDWTRALASDELQGRAPGTEGETRTIAWLIAQFQALGLDPGGENGGWTQRVPLIRTQVRAEAAFSVAGHGQTLVLRSPRDIYVSTVREGRALAFSRDWPAWRQGSEFQAVRERSADRRH